MDSCLYGLILLTIWGCHMQMNNSKVFCFFPIALLPMLISHNCIVSVITSTWLSSKSWFPYLFCLCIQLLGCITNYRWLMYLKPFPGKLNSLFSLIIVHFFVPLFIYDMVIILFSRSLWPYLNFTFTIYLKPVKLKLISSLYIYQIYF